MKNKIINTAAALIMMAAGLALSSCTDLFDEDGTSSAASVKQTASVAVTKDGAAWTDSGKTVALYSGSTQAASLTDSDGDGTYTGDIAPGTYEVYVDGKDTGVKYTVGSTASPAALDYYSVNVTGTGITVTPVAGYENPVLAGGTYKFSVSVAEGYTGTPVLKYADGTTITPDSDGVYTVTVTSSAVSIALDSGITALPYTAVVTLKKDGTAWTDSGKKLALYADTTKKYDLTESSGTGEFSASTFSSHGGTFSIYVGTDSDAKDTGIDITVTDTNGNAEVDYYTVTFSGDGLIITDVSENPVLSGSDYSFTYTLADGCSGTPVITTAGGTVLNSTADASYPNGVYTVSGITGLQTLTVTGITKTDCGAPVFSVKAGNYGVAQSVQITTPTAGAAIYYTTDGTDPTTASTKYTGAVNVAVVKESATTIKAIAVKKNYNDSGIASAEYSFYYNWYFKDTGASTFYIEDAHSLWQLANLVNKEDTVTTGLTDPVTFSGRTVQLTDDIDLGTVCSAKLGNWTTIGKYDSATSTSYSFDGTFDGNGREIRNLYINTTENVNGGLFDIAQNVKNLTVSGTVTTPSLAGGIAVEISGDVTNCVNNCAVSSASYTGGIALSIDGITENCTNNGSVTGSGGSTGGIVADSKNGIAIINCKNTGTITYKGPDGTGASIGGIVGMSAPNGTYQYIAGCINTGAVEGTAANAGGICGTSYSTTYSTCLNTGSVKGVCAGGIAGQINSGKIVSCCSWTDTVSGTTKSGGIAGSINDNGTAESIAACYYKSSTSSTSFKGLGSGKDTDTYTDAQNKTYTYTTAAVASLYALNTTDVTLMNTAHDTTYDYMFKAGADATNDLPTITAGAYKLTVTFPSTGDISLSSDSFSGHGYIYADVDGLPEALQSGGTYAWYFNNGSSSVCSSSKCTFGAGSEYNVDSATMVAGKTYLLVVTYTVNGQTYTGQCQITKTSD